MLLYVLRIRVLLVASGVSFALQSVAQREYPATPQTIAYERYLLGDASPLRPNEVPRLTELAHEQVGVIERHADWHGDRAVDPEVGVRLTFVDLTRDGIPSGDFDALLAELNVMYDFADDAVEGLSALTFCRERTLRPADMLSAVTGDYPLEGSGDTVLTNYAGLVSRYGHRVDVRGTLPVVVVDGSADFLGFASTVPHDGLTDAVVVAGELLRDSIPGRTEGETVGQLIANYIGLKPIWYADSPYGDMVHDTPCHNGPNYGTYEPGEAHLSMCDGMPLELVDNFMDNTAESVRTSWTRGQVERLRMLLSLQEFRHALVREPCPEPDEYVWGRDLDVAPEYDGLVGGLGDVTVRLRPNPVSSLLHLTLEGGTAAELTERAVIYVTDAAGARVSVPVETVSPTAYTLNFGTLPQGSYHVTVVPSDGRPRSRVVYKL